jgi:CRISPR-associated protein Cmr3
VKLQHGDNTTFILPSGKVFQGGKEKIIVQDERVLKGNKAILKDYDQKNYLIDISEQIIGPESEQVSVFSKSQQIGIKKNYQGQTEEDSFFKQTFSRLQTNHEKHRYSFAFYAEFTREIKTDELKSEMVFMGGDQSLFRLEYKRLGEEPVMENPFEKIVEQNNLFIENATESDTFKVVLLSDCKLDKSAFGKALAGINEIVDFRHIITKTETTRFSHMSSHKTDLNKSDKHDLIARGSVFYVKGTHLNEFCEEFKKYPAYITIGYNYYQISK